MNTGLGLLTMGAIASVVFWISLKDGVAGYYGLQVKRRTNPVGYWIMQGMLGFVAAVSVIVGALMLFGIVRR